MGREAFEKMVREFRAKFPGAVCSRASGVDTHHNLYYRYNWEIHRGGELMLPGFDAAEINNEGQVCRIEGFFFGPLPEA